MRNTNYSSKSVLSQVEQKRVTRSSGSTLFQYPNLAGKHFKTNKQLVKKSTGDTSPHMGASSIRSSQRNGLNSSVTSSMRSLSGTRKKKSKQRTSKPVNQKTSLSNQMRNMMMIAPSKSLKSLRSSQGDMPIDPQQTELQLPVSAAEYQMKSFAESSDQKSLLKASHDTFVRNSRRLSLEKQQYQEAKSMLPEGSATKIMPKSG